MPSWDSSVIGEGAVITGVRSGRQGGGGGGHRQDEPFGAQGRRVLFGRYGVTGLVNVDQTPEFAARLGAAFAATLPKGSTVTINRDPHRSPRMLKRGIISGLPSAGVNALDVRSVPIPVARYITRVSNTAGGVHVRLSPYDSRVVDIRFFDDQGQDLTKDAERNIERVFFRDFGGCIRRVGTVEYAPGVIERHTQDFLAALDVEAIRAARPNIVVDQPPRRRRWCPHPQRTAVPGGGAQRPIDETRMSIRQTSLTARCSNWR